MKVSVAPSVRYLPVLVLLSLVTALPAQAQRASLSSTSLSFGSVAVGNSSPAQTVTLSDSSSTSLRITSVAVTGDYSQTSTCGTSVAGRGSCTISITFKPTATGRRNGTLTVRDNANSSPQTASLTGTGTAAAASLTISPASLTFASQTVNTTSAPQTITISNTGTASFTLSNISISGNYARTTTCGSSLGAGSSCSISVTFTPTNTGTRTGTVSFTAGGTAKTVSLTGTGVTATVSVTVSPTALTFASQTVGTSSAAQGVTITNTGSSSFTLSSFGISGDFARTTTCGSSLGAGASCSVSVTFTPTATGTRTGSLTFTAGTTAENVSLTGQGTQSFSYSPTSLDFGALPTGTTVTKTVTLTNSGAAPLALQVLPLASQPPDYSVVNNCGAQVPAAGSCSLAVSFESHTVGNWVTSYNGELLNFTVNGTQNSITLSATAYMAQPLISPTSIDFGSVAVGQVSASNSISISTVPPGITGGVQSVVASGDFVQTNTCASVNPCSVTITFRPAATGVRTGSITVNYPSPTPSQVVTLTGTGTPSSGACAAPQIDLKLLVVSSGKTEADYGAITQILGYVGTPYTVLDFKATPGGITAAMLSDGSCHGFYQGVIFANGGYIYTVQGMALLTAYEQKFGIRQLNWFASPTADFGLSTPNKTLASSTTYSANFTPAAASIFPAINTNTPLTITSASIYLAAPGAGSITPLLTDAAGNVLSVIYDQGDGREYLTQTFDSNQYLVHDLVLAYSLLNWVTKGTFLGEYHVYASPQVDDVFIDDAEWVAGTSCGTDSDADSLPTFRLNANDVDTFVAWQSAKQSNPLLSNFMVSLAFNGIGTTGDTDYTGLPNGATDTLTPELQKYQANFNWISHTWDHPDSLNGMSQALIDGEVNPNNAEAATLGFTHFTTGNMVTPGVTGLNDTKVPGELVKDGIRYVVTDTSVIGQINNGPNPSPNVGIVNSYATQLYEVPRHANNMFFNVATPSDWTAEYHCIYAGQAPYSTYTYQQIQDYISASFVVNMLMGDMDPEMFHQPNMHNYDGQGHSILGDLYDETFNSYFKVYNLPVLSPSLDVLANKMQARNQYNLSKVTASITGGSSPTISISVPSTATVPSAVIPITGLNSTGAEVYGGQNISHVTVNVGQTVTLPVE